MDILTSTHALRDFFSATQLRSVTADDAGQMIETLLGQPPREATWNALLELLGAWPDATDVARWVDALEPRIDHWPWRSRQSSLGQRHTQGDHACVYRLVGYLTIGKIDDSTGQKFKGFANQPLWRHLRGLRLHDVEVDRDALATFIASPDRERLEALVLQGIGRQSGAMRALFAGARVNALTELRLLGLDLRKDDLLTLAELPLASSLRLLDVSSNFLSAKDVVELLAPDRFAGLEVLVIGNTDLTADELQDVVAGLSHPRLRRLEFPHSPSAETLGQEAMDLEVD